MFKIIFIVFTGFLFIGCTVVKPHVTEFRINPIVKNYEGEVVNSCSKTSLKISRAFSSNALMSQNMHYGLGEYKRESFTQSQWAESPNKEITAQLLQMLQNSKLFKNVQISSSRSKSGLILETNIEEFMQYFSKDKKSSQVKIVISNTLINPKTNVTLKTKTFSQSVKAKTLDAQGGVIALSQALAIVLERQREWLSDICQ